MIQKIMIGGGLVVEQKLMYRSNDGKLHETENKAKKYAIDKICQLIYDKIKDKALNKKRIQYKHLVDIINLIVVDYDDFSDLLKKIMHYF